MLSEIEIPEIRTLLQSLDTARYLGDVELDREIDISQARTEVLMAMIFGRQVVVPAGSIADCPGFQKIFNEVIGAREGVQGNPYATTSYRLFRVGLEQGFESYDDFVVDYLRNYVNSDVELVAMQEIAEKGKLSKAEMLVMMARAYLERNFTLIDKYSNLGFYFERISREFGSTGQPAISLASRARIFTGGEEGLARPMKGLLARVREQHGHLDAVKAIDEGIVAMEKDARPLQFRGSWYRPESRARFGDSWDVARLWLDYCLNTEFTARYRVHVPSYFLQEIDEHKYPLGVPLAFANADAVERLSSEGGGANRYLSATSEHVDWGRMWMLVSEPAFQKSLATMNAKIASAVRDERRAIETAQEGFGDDAPLLRREITEARRIRQTQISDAMNAHIEAALGQLPGFSVATRGGRILLNLHDKAKELVPSAFARTLISASAKGGALAIGPIWLLGAMGVAESIINSALVATALGAVTETVSTGAEHLISRIARPTVDSLLGVSEDEIDKNIAHVNLWLGANYIP